MHEFGKYIKIIRETKGLTLNQVALYSGISSGQLSRIENGQRGVPKIQTVMKLSKMLKIDLNILVLLAYGEVEDDEFDLKYRIESLLELVELESIKYNGEILDEKRKKLLKKIMELALDL